MISVKNHQIPPTILVERALGISSDPVTMTSKGDGQIPQEHNYDIAPDTEGEIQTGLIASLTSDLTLYYIPQVHVTVGGLLMCFSSLGK